MDYRDRVVIVTGASSGIGREIALDFAGRGARLVLCARRAAALDETAAGCRARGAEVEALVGDLAERAFAESLVDRAVARFSRLDIVVNNAGVPKHKSIFEVTPEDVEHTLAVNFLAAAYVVLAALPPMLAQGEGFLVNISSAAGRLPPPRETVYAASKFALTGFTEGLALDLAGSGIHSAVIHVGPIDTEIWDKLDSPSRFSGRKFPPAIVAAAVRRAIEKRRHAVTVPRRMSLAFGFSVLLPGLFRWGAGRWDPAPKASVVAARLRARGD